MSYKQDLIKAEKLASQIDLRVIFTKHSGNSRQVIDTPPSAFINILSDRSVSPSNTSSGIYYNGKTYLVFQSTFDDPYIITYTHATSTWSAPVKIGDSPSIGDAHGQPAMLIDSDGYIHVMWGAHASPFYYAKSTNPEDITAWTPMDSPGIGTYPQLMQLSDGTIYMFYRNADAQKWDFITSINSGVNWSAPTHIFVDHAFGYAYFTKGIGDVIHGVPFTHPATTNYTRRDIYYLYFNGTNWKNITGTNLVLPITFSTTGVLVYDSGDKYIPAVSVCFDASNNPYIFFTEGIEGSGITGTYNYRFVKYIGGAWVITNLGAWVGYWRDFATAIDYVSPNRFDAYIINGGTPNTLGGNIEKWSSTDNGATWLGITSLLKGQYFDPIMVKNHHSDAKVFIAESKELGTFDNRGFLYGDSGFI